MEQQRRESQFNSSLESLRRLGNALEQANIMSMMATYEGMWPEYLKTWRNALMNAYKEIYPKINKKERLMVNSIKNKRAEGKMYEPQQFGYDINKKVFAQYYNFNYKLELLIRRLATKYGLLITDKKSFGDELE